MTTTYKLLTIPFWLAALLGVLGCIITFFPGAECAWFSVVAVLSLFGLFIPKIFYRSAATLLLILSIIAAVHGYQRGMKYLANAATRQSAKNDQNAIAFSDPINRFVADYPNREWPSIAYHATGVPSSTDPREAIAKLRQTGIHEPPITNLALIELRELHPRDRLAARLLTNHVAALVDTEIGQRIVLLRPSSGDWCYHVYDAK
jgi:hypothetical protein